MTANTMQVMTSSSYLTPYFILCSNFSNMKYNYKKITFFNFLSRMKETIVLFKMVCYLRCHFCTSLCRQILKVILIFMQIIKAYSGREVRQGFYHTSTHNEAAGRSKHTSAAEHSRGSRLCVFLFDFVSVWSSSLAGGE